MKILFTADWHIKLDQDKVPKNWQKNRFLMLVDELNRIFKEEQCDQHIIGGDIFDVPDPSSEEVELFEKLLSRLNHKGLIYTGNHELKSKTVSCLDHYSGIVSKVTEGKWDVVSFQYRSNEFDIVPYTYLHKDTWKENISRLCFTHVRGEIKPHVVPEIDLNHFADYELVIAGDLHSFQCTQTIPLTGKPLVYPGSPLTTSFHRSRTTQDNGALIIDTDTLEYKWIDLSHLPQLIRKTIEVGDEMEGSSYDRVIYEVTGSVTDLKKIGKSDLLDKKINNKITKDAKLDLLGLTFLQELVKYMEDIEHLDKKDISRLTSELAQIAPEYINVDNNS